MNAGRQLNILVIYVSRTYPLRASQRDHLAAFGKYLRSARVFYVNVAFGGVPAFLRRVDFDLIIFHWTFLGARVDRPWFSGRTADLQRLEGFSGIRIALPQDEFASMDLLCDFIRTFGVQHVFSVAAPAQWPLIYAGVDLDSTRFHRVLTGYLDDDLVARVEHMGARALRSIDIGYRTVSTAIWGRFNLVKAELGALFQGIAKQHGFIADIKIGTEHFYQGDDWIRFLLRCRYTLGVEGGSSLLDWNGSLALKIGEYLKKHPGAGFDELERQCIGFGRDGEIDVVALSPRHLEACLTRTVQILVEGEYNGVLSPDEHYIPLKRDYSNLDNVVRRLFDEDERCRLANAAYAHVVSSKMFTYRAFSEYVVRTSLQDSPAKSPEEDELASVLSYLANRMQEAARWLFVACYSGLRTIRNSVIRHAD